MYSPKKQQIEICLLKYGLEEIENNLIQQRSAIPALDDENEKKYRETLTALRTARSLNEEMERLKQENVRLTARRMQVKRQADDVTEALQQARDRRNSLEQETRKEEHDTELHVY
ncbi:unnamed protein product [Danaus chrysippus]|uniref:(African queen) hypothetical protein n=1 Tax=Danaus chrysippus TaxID=151541 RepID=A0A8J2QGP6_9NEOP|nr:unnamed protein product [Danaus chrysippus]